MLDKVSTTSNFLPNISFALLFADHADPCDNMSASLLNTFGDINGNLTQSGQTANYSSC